MSGILEIPNGVNIYIDRISNRCDNLITSGIWSGLDRNRLRYWLESFKQIEDKYFAAMMLDNLIFRSEGQTKSLMIQSVQKAIPQLLQDVPYFDSYRGKWLELLGKGGPSIRVVPVIRRKDGPTQSGNTIGREYSRLINVKKEIIIDPSNIEKAKLNGTKLIIFVDDSLFTGDQFSDFFSDVAGYFDQDLFAVYIPLCAHQNGIDNIQSKYPQLRVTSADILNTKNSFFKNGSELTPDGINTYAALKEVYLKLVNQRIPDYKGEIEGYGKLSLIYGFYNATPNATLPLLWSKENSNQFLLERI